MQTIKERRKEGKAYRKTTPRSELGVWEVSTERRDALELVIRQEETRVPVLIPERRRRMLVSPFTFFRGSAILQAHDLSMTPRTDFRVQACGDAHISNFGIFGSPERRLVFDINDFDETLPAPFEVDVKRLAASIEICGRDRGFSRHKREATVFDAVQLYRKKLLECSEMGNMEVWYRHVDVENLIRANAQSLDKKQMKKIQGMLEKASATLAFAHAKTGDRHALAGYLGEEETFEEAMVKYASAYADQNESDFETFRTISAETAHR